MTHPSPQSGIPAAAPRRLTPADYGAALLLALAAVTPRCMGWSMESVWWDEYTSVMHLNTPGLLDFLSLNRSLDPATLPFYYLFEHLWWHHVSASVNGLRLLSALIGSGAVAVLFLFGSRWFGRTAGFAAALCMALSPVHIFHGRSIRMYGVLTLLALLSCWMLLELIRRPSAGRWAAAVLLSLLLSWTHPFAGLVPAAQGLFLLAARPWPLRRTLLWGVATTAAFLPVLAYLSTVRFWPNTSTGQWMALPGVGGFLADVLFDDVVSFTYQLRLSGFGAALGAARWLPDMALAGLLAVAAVVGGVRAVRGRRIPLLLCLFWLVVPPVMLYAASLLWRPCIFPRYTVHASLALYLLAGHAVAGLPCRWQRVLSAVLLCGLTGAQWCFTLPGPQHTDWRGAARLIHAESGGMPVLVEESVWRDVYRLNEAMDFPGETRVTAAGERPGVLARQAAFLLARQGETPAGVALVAEGGYFDDSPPEELETALKAAGLDFDKRMMPAVQTLWVYFLRPGALPSALDPLAADTAEGRDLDHFTAQGFGDLAAELASNGDPGAAAEALALVTARSSFAEKVYRSLAAAIRDKRPVQPAIAATRALWDGYGHRENGRAAFARDSFARAVEQDPSLAVAWAELGLEETRLGGPDAARALGEAGRLDPEYAEAFRRLIAAVGGEGPVRERLAAVEQFLAGKLLLGRGDAAGAAEALEAAAQADPGLLDTYVSLMYAQTLTGNVDAARDALARYEARGGPPHGGMLANLAILLLDAGDKAGAAAAWHRAEAADPKMGETYGALFALLTGPGDAAPARREAERLRAAGIPVPPPITALLERNP